MNSRKLIFTLLLVLILLTGAVAGVQAASGINGDVNDDGLINIIDALMVAQAYVGDPPPPGFNDAQADANGDGTVTIVDALVIAQYAVGLISSIPAACYTVTVTPTAYASVQPVLSCYPRGTKVTFTAVPYYAVTAPPGTIIIGGDFYFSNWKLNGNAIVSTATTFEYTVNFNMTMEAVYSQIF